MKKTISLLIHSGIFSLSFFFRPALGLGRNFYLGKNIRFIVGYAPGGGYDTYTRAIARFMGKTLYLFETLLRRP